MQPIFTLTADINDICYPDDWSGVEVDKYTILISVSVETTTTIEALEYDLICAANSGSDRTLPRAITDSQVTEAIASELRDIELKHYFSDDDEDDDDSYYHCYMSLTWDYDSCIELSVPQHLLSAIVNCDRSGLTDEDEKCLDTFLAWTEADLKRSYPKCSSVSWVFEEEANFDPNHDVTGIDACDCVDAKLVAHL